MRRRSGLAEFHVLCLLALLGMGCGRHDAFVRTIDLDTVALPVEVELRRAETLELWVELTLRYPGISEADLGRGGEFMAPKVVAVVVEIDDELGTREIRCSPTSLRPGGGYLVRPEVVAVRGRMLDCDPQLQPGHSTVTIRLEPARTPQWADAVTDQITIRGAVVRSRRHRAPDE